MALKAKVAAQAASLDLSQIAVPTQPVMLNPLEAQQIRQLSIEERERSLNLIIDSEGRTIDKRTGEVVQLQSRMPTLKANIKAQKRDYRTAMTGDKKGDAASGIATTMSGFSSVFTGVASVIDTKAQPIPQPAPTEGVSELFFDPRLK